MANVAETITSQIIQRVTENLAQQQPSPSSQLNNAMNAAFGARQQNGLHQQQQALSPEMLAQAALAMQDMIEQSESPPERMANRVVSPRVLCASPPNRNGGNGTGQIAGAVRRRRLPPRDGADQAPGAGDAGRQNGGLGGGLFGNRAGGDDSDPMLDPVTSAAVIAHCGISEHMSCPRNMVKKSMLVMTLQATRDIRWWKSRAVPMGVFTQDEVDGIHSKDIIVDKVMQSCPFV